MELGLFSFIIVVVLFVLFKGIVQPIVRTVNSVFKGAGTAAAEATTGIAHAAETLSSHAEKMATDADVSLMKYYKELEEQGIDVEALKAKRAAVRAKITGE